LPTFSIHQEVGGRQVKTAGHPAPASLPGAAPVGTIWTPAPRTGPPAARRGPSARPLPRPTLAGAPGGASASARAARSAGSRGRDTLITTAAPRRTRGVLRGNRVVLLQHLALDGDHAHEPPPSRSGDPRARPAGRRRRRDRPPGPQPAKGVPPRPRRSRLQRFNQHARAVPDAEPDLAGRSRPGPSERACARCPARSAPHPVHAWAGAAAAIVSRTSAAAAGIAADNRRRQRG